MIQNIIVFDFETVGLNPHDTEEKLGCEPSQLAAIAIDGKTLKPKGTFNSLMRPLRPDDIEEGALAVTGQTRELLASAPPPKVVWSDFVAFTKKHQTTKTAFGLPIACGYNIRNYDMPIINRLAKDYGTTRKDKFSKQIVQNVFSDFQQIDVMDIISDWHRGSNCLKEWSNEGRANIKLTTVCNWLGIEFGAHDALEDVKATAAVVCSFFKLYRKMLGNGRAVSQGGTGKVSFHDKFKGLSSDRWFD